jgi:3',5'-cyclic AMP phosphodiesterase CpdA
MTIAHLSDIHFGRIAHEHIVQVLVDEVNAGDVDLVAISGDLTQRAREREFKAASTMIDRFEAPVLVVPGNHDVYPWWHPIKRLCRPLARYRTHITPELTPRFEQNGVAVLGLNTAHGRTVKGGRIDADDLDAIRSYFGEVDDGTFTVLVLHHHLTKIRALGRHDIARYAQDALDAAAASGVDLILCGHLHVSHIEPVEIIPGQQRIVVASAGTATSNRGRKSNRATNFYNLIRVSAGRFQVEERIYRPRVHQFVAESTTTFDRSAPATPTGRNDTPG